MKTLKDNHGWGLQTMLIFTGALLLGILVSAVIIEQNFSSVQKPGQNEPQVSYADLEQQAVQAAKKYVDKYYQTDLETYTNYYVRISQLKKEKMIESIVDIKDDTIICTGYVVFAKQEEVVFTPYLKCGKNYTTKGYTARHDE